MYKTMILLTSKSNLTIDNLNERIKKIKKGHTGRPANIKRMLLAEMDSLNKIITGLTQSAIQIPDSINIAMNELGVLLSALDVLLSAEDIDTKPISECIIDVHTKIQNEVDINSFINIVYQQIITDLTNSEKISDQNMTHIKSLLEVIPEHDLKELACELAKHENISKVEVTNFLKLSGYINQYKLDNKLSKLGLNNVAKFPIPGILFDRVIVTTKDSLEGLNLIINYLENTGTTVLDIRSGRVSAIFIANYYSQTMSRLPSGFEIAWALLDMLFKRSEIGINTFVTTSFYCAEEIMTKLNDNATLVLDGHGGAINCVFADKPNFMAAELLSEIKELLVKDSTECIDHIILQSCSSGTLKQHHALTTFIPKDKVGKGRQIVLSGTDIKASELFEKVGVLDSLASQVFQALIDSSRTQTAFTFTEDLICPGILIGEGHKGIPKSIFGAHLATPWPQNMLELNQAGQVPKSTTIVLDAKHRKAGSARGFFQSMGFTSKNFRDLAELRGASSASLDGSIFTTDDEDISETPISGILSASSGETLFSPEISRKRSPGSNSSSFFARSLSDSFDTSGEIIEDEAPLSPMRVVDTDTNNNNNFITPIKDGNRPKKARTGDLLTSDGDAYMASLESLYTTQDEDSEITNRMGFM